MTDRPTIYLTNAASRTPPRRGPGRVYTIMAAPRVHFGEMADGPVLDLVPRLADVRAAKAGALAVEEYRERYMVFVRLALEVGALSPGLLAASPLPVGSPECDVEDGDTLICCCSRDEAAAGRCHRVWAAEALAEAGWRVVLDGKELPRA